MKKWWGVIVLMLLWIVIVLQTYKSGTYLLGWDSLVPEMHMELNIGRAMSAVWQEFQGIGLLGGMGHAADLPRMLILYPLSLILPVTMLRWAWVLGMLLMGGVGVYTLGLVLGGGTIAATVGAVFYMLNPSVVQTFSTPFETFVSFYGLFPWMITKLLIFLKTGRQKDLAYLFLWSLVGASAFVVQTLFVVYGISIGAILLNYFIRERKIVRGLRAVGVVVGANFYWLLPVLWFGVRNAWVNVGAKMNLIATHEVELMSVSYGKLADFMTLRGWWLQNTDVNTNGEMGLLIEPWTIWLRSEWIERLGVVLFLLSVVGIMAYLMKREKFSENKWSWSWIGLLFVAMIMLMRRVSLFAYIYELIANSLPLFGQMFRASYTKWSTVVAMLFAVGLTQLITVVISKWMKYGMSLVVIVSCLAIMWPIFGKGLVGERMKVNLPNEYLNLFDEMYALPDGRIAKLPANSLWGWQYNDWGYRGSGFLWYGIKQPILDRAFDVWSPYNEGFYHEFSTAMYGGDKKEIEQVLQKYDVRYVLLDESVIAPGQDKAILRIEETKRLASELGWEEAFHDGFLTVWDRGEQAGWEYVSAPATYVTAEGDTLKTRRDVMYAETGSYVSGNGGVVYPFAELTREEMKNIEYKKDGLQLTARGIQPGQELVVPGWESGEWVELGYSVMWKDGKVKIDWNPVYRVGKMLERKLEVFDDWRGPSLPTSTYPIKTSQDSIWVQIEGSEAIYLHAGEQGGGRAKLQVGRPVATTVFAGQGKELVTQVGEEQPCGEQGELRCWATPLTKATTNSLVQTITHYEGTVSPEVCWDLEGEPYECVNMTKKGVSPIVIAHPVGVGERYWVDWVVRDEATKMQALGVVEYPLLDRNEMGSEWWGEFLHERAYKTMEEPMVVSVVGKARTYELAKLGKRTIESCDVLKRGTAEKQGNTYIADERGAACDYVEVTELDTRLPYVMRLQGENVEGRSLKLFVYNTGSQRNDLEYLLGRGSFDQSFTLLPWDFGGTYSLNMETRSFGQRAENQIAPVEVRYFPLRQLAGAKIIDSEAANAPITNGAQIKEVKKTGTWLYRVNVEGTGLLKLSQGYDEGWVGVGLRHVKVDGWANGWLTTGETQIYLIYWPQLLEFAGLGILVTTLVVVMRKKKLA